MAVDYSAYKLIGWNEILDLEREFGDKYRQFRIDIAQWMFDLHCGEWFSIVGAVAEESAIPGMIKAICWVMSTQTGPVPRGIQWEFNETYTAVRRLS